MNAIKKYSKEDQTVAVNILLLAFSSDPFQRYLMPDPSIFFKNSTVWFNNAASQSISKKSLFGTEDHSGVALWFPPNFIVDFDAIGERLKDIPSNYQKDKILNDIEAKFRSSSF